MERIDGYLVIDDCKRVVSEKDDEQYWVYIDGEEYYFKPTVFGSRNYAYNELLGYHAAKFLGLGACFCDLAILNGEKGIISKSLRNDKVKLVSGSEILGDYLALNFDMVKDMGFDKELADSVYEYGLSGDKKYFSAMYVNNLEIIWHALEYRYKDKININEVMHQFILMYIFTIIFGDADKNPNNWFIMEDGDDISLSYLFDSMDIFIGYEAGYDPDKMTMSFSTNFKDYEVNLEESLKTFFKTSPREYYNWFVAIFNKVIMNFFVILEEIEKQIGMKIPLHDRNRLISNFNKNSLRIIEVIDSFSFMKEH